MTATDPVKGAESDTKISEKTPFNINQSMDHPTEDLKSHSQTKCQEQQFKLNR